MVDTGTQIVESTMRVVSALQNASSTQVVVVSGAIVGTGVAVELYTNNKEDAHFQKDVKKEQIGRYEGQGRPWAAESVRVQAERDEPLFQKKRSHGVLTGLTNHLDLRTPTQVGRDSAEQARFESALKESTERE